MALGADPEERPDVRVARLVKELGASDFSTRRRAYDQLEKVGPEGRLKLEQAANDADPEVRLHARRLLEQLRLEDLWAPRRVTFKSVDEPASKVLLQLAAQTGNHVHIGDPYGNFAEKQLDVDYANCNYWEALDDICRRTGNRVRPHYDMHTPGVVVSSGPIGKHPKAYAGPVRAQITSARRVFIEEVNYDEQKSELTHGFQINLQFTWEDRFQIVGYGQPELVEGRTDNHVVLSSAQPAGASWNAANRGLRQVTASIKLNPVPVSAQSLDTFAIRWGLIAIGEPATLEIADLAVDRPHGQDDVVATVEGLEKLGAGKVTLTLNVQRDLALPEPFEVVYQEYETELIDEQGRPFRLQGQTHALTDRGVQLKISYIGESPDSQPRAVRLKYPKLRARRDLQLVFRNVPLPVSKPE